MLDTLYNTMLHGIAIMSFSRRMKRWLVRRALNKSYGKGAVDKMSDEQRNAIAKLRPRDRVPVVWDDTDNTFHRFVPKSEASRADLAAGIVTQAQLNRLTADPTNKAVQADMGIAVEPRAADGVPGLLIPAPRTADGRPVDYFNQQRRRITAEQFTEAYRLAYNANGEAIAQVHRIARPEGHTPVNPADAVPLLPDPNYEPPLMIADQTHERLCPICGRSTDKCRDCGPVGWRGHPHQIAFDRVFTCHQCGMVHALCVCAL